MQTELSKYRDTYAFESFYGLKSIVLYHGNILSFREPIDVLVVSAFQYDYTPTCTSLIGHLKFEKNIDVEKLSHDPELDLRSTQGVWLSKKINSSDETTIKRIACVELAPVTELFFSDEEIHKKIIALFAMLSAAQYSAIELDTIAMRCR